MVSHLSEAALSHLESHLPFSLAAFAYNNVQIVGVAGAETINSRVAIPKAVRRTYIRIVLFYVMSIFVIGLIVPSTSAALYHGDGTAATAPFVIAIKAAGIKVLPSIVNAVVLTSAFSSVRELCPSTFAVWLTIPGVCRAFRAFLSHHARS